MNLGEIRVTGEEDKRVRPAWREPAFGIAVLLWVVYSLLWTEISVLRLYAFRASVYDLGAGLQGAWMVVHSPSALYSIASLFVTGGGYLFAPLLAFPVWTDLAVQSIALGACGPLAYLIARRLGLGTWTSLGFAAVPLLYFPFGGLNFDDLHYEALLVPLFMAAYYAALTRRWNWSVLALAICGILFFPTALLVLLFGVALTVSVVIQKVRARRSVVPTGHRGILSRIVAWVGTEFSFDLPVGWYPLAVLVLGDVLLLAGYFLLTYYSPGWGFSYLLHTQGAPPGIFYDWGSKWFTVLLVLAPLAFLPLLSPRWMLMSLPFFFLMFIANDPAYFYPSLVFDWYSFLFLPFLFLGAIDGLARLQRSETWLHSLVASIRHRFGPPTTPAHGRTHIRRADSLMSLPRRRRMRAVPRVADVVVVLVVVGMVASGWYLLPIGPANGSTPASFYTTQLFYSNRTLYNQFEDLVGLVPSQDPHVIFQDNMPELLPRPLLPGALSPMIAGIFNTVAYNLTYLSRSNTWLPINADYVVGNPWPTPYNWFNFAGAFPYNTSIQEILYDLYGAGTYGIVGEASGMMVIEHGYTGPLKVYDPYFDRFAPSAFESASGSVGYPGCPSCLVTRNLTNGETAWSGPNVPYGQAWLSPGYYNVTFKVGAVDWNDSSSVNMSVVTYGPSPVVYQTMWSPGAGNFMANLTLSVHVVNGPVTFAIQAIDSHFSGAFVYYGSVVEQTAPPPSVFP